MSNKTSNKASVLILPFLFFGVLVASSAWAKNYPLTSGRSTPAATGKVEVDKDKNGNYEITIKAERLAQPGMLTPAATTYVVWFQDRDGQPMNQGQLRVDKKLSGEFKTTTQSQNFDLFITAEGDPTTKSPSDQVVLRAKIQE